MSSPWGRSGTQTPLSKPRQPTPRVQPTAACLWPCTGTACTENYPKMFAARKRCAKGSAGKFPLLARLQELGPEGALMHLSRTEHLMLLLHMRGGKNREECRRAEESGACAVECLRWTAARHSASSLSPAGFLFCNSSILSLSNLY